MPATTVGPSGVQGAQAAWRDWLRSERRLSVHTLTAYEHDVATFLGFMTGYLGRAPTLSPEQAAAAAALRETVQAGGFSVTLIDGVPPLPTVSSG